MCRFTCVTLPFFNISPFVRFKPPLCVWSSTCNLQKLLHRRKNSLRSRLSLRHFIPINSNLWHLLVRSLLIWMKREEAWTLWIFYLCIFIFFSTNGKENGLTATHFLYVFVCVWIILLLYHGMEQNILIFSHFSQNRNVFIYNATKVIKYSAQVGCSQEPRQFFFMLRIDFFCTSLILCQTTNKEFCFLEGMYFVHCLSPQRFIWKSSYIYKQTTNMS